MWQLSVRYPHREPVVRELPEPYTLEELRAALGVEGGQMLLTTHKAYPDQQYAVEQLEQLHNGASVTVAVRPADLCPAPLGSEPLQRCIKALPRSIAYTS